MKYKDLNLKKIRDEHDLDFAHFTYLKGQCSCCYGPKDLPKRYWKNNIIPESNNYTYILFKNANNGSGCVKRGDEIKKCQCVSWRMPYEKLHGVCLALKEQFGDDYYVLEPKNDLYTIIIMKKDYEYCYKYLQDGCYILV